MTTPNAFAEYTRSTAFSMSLSAKMVDRILRLDARIRGWEIGADLATRFDWYKPDGPPAFGPTSVEDMLADGLTNTSRALLRRGLVEIAVLDVANDDLEIVDAEIIAASTGTSHQSHFLTLTNAGRLTAQLLVEAGFDPYPAHGPTGPDPPRRPTEDQPRSGPRHPGAPRPPPRSDAARGTSPTSISSASTRRPRHDPPSTPRRSTPNSPNRSTTKPSTTGPWPTSRIDGHLRTQAGRQLHQRGTDLHTR